MKNLQAAAVFMCCAFAGSAQSSGEIYKKLQQLNSFGKVLYIAAHPDDENTRAISWLSRGKNASVAYLSLTRGDGGQNMIGTELGAELGLIRTCELLAARKIDGGKQYFTRAVDFGYSKSAGETLEKWNRRLVLSDVVRVIRHFQPDLIITRFPPDGRGGHGHHTASAILALEAFDLAASDTAFADQLDDLNPWRAKSIYWNTYSWRDGRNLDSLSRVNPDYLKVDVGGFDPWLGVSYNEIASSARSQHRSQGFGVNIARGSDLEYFQYLNGYKIENDILEMVDRNWVSIGGSERMAGDLNKILRGFDFSNPAASIGTLIAFRETLNNLRESREKQNRLAALDEIIADCLGIYAEAVAEVPMALAGSSVPVKIKVLSRLSDKVLIQSVDWPQGGISFKKARELPINQAVLFESEARLPQDVSQPYWLRKDYKESFTIDDPKMIVHAINPPEVEIDLMLVVDGASFHLSVPLEYVWSDRVLGERRRPVVATPRASINFTDDVYIFANAEPRQVRLKLKIFEGGFSGKVSLQVDEGWSVSPGFIEVKTDQAGSIVPLVFEVSPPEGQAESTIKPKIEGISDAVLAYSEIAYEHIPTQVVFTESRSRLVRVSLQHSEGLIGYIPGAGDEVAEAIGQMGYNVDILDRATLTTAEDLLKYRAIVVGIRAYNVNDWLPDYQNKLLRYVEEGGHLLVQYNTATRDLPKVQLGPYPIKLSRARVSEEDAAAEITVPNHPFFQYPNVITSEDFEGWVQERGLYFASEWDPNYQALIAWADEGEEPQSGGLLTTKYGKGTFTYTGISFFRQLPAGVPGAYRLLANILSHDQIEE